MHQAMPKFKPLPPLEELQAAFDYDPASGLFRHKRPSSGKLVKGAVAGFLGSDGYVRFSYKRRPLSAHRVAWFFCTGEDPLQSEVDHKDRNRSNNRFSNLRLASSTQNHWNSPAKGYNRTRNNKYKAQIRTGGSIKYLGTYSTEEEAHQAYLKAARELRGEWCGL